MISCKEHHNLVGRTHGDGYYKMPAEHSGAKARPSIEHTGSGRAFCSHPSSRRLRSQGMGLWLFHSAAVTGKAKWRGRP